jgi:hypothetical protein
VRELDARDWLIRVILAILLLLAVYAMSLGWSALSGDSTAQSRLDLPRDGPNA